jgi:hypothetical protein
VSLGEGNHDKNQANYSKKKKRKLNPLVNLYKIITKNP